MTELDLANALERVASRIDTVPGSFIKTAKEAFLELAKELRDSHVESSAR